MDEIWKDISGYTDYRVSNLGRVLSMRTSKPKFLKGALVWNAGSKKIYRKVELQKPAPYKEARSIGIHLLVWRAFRGEIPDDCYLGFINEDTTDPRLENLQLCKRLGREPISYT